MGLGWLVHVQHKSRLLKYEGYSFVGEKTERMKASPIALDLSRLAR